MDDSGWIFKGNLSRIPQMLTTFLLVTLASTAAFELFTCLGRFLFGLRSREIAPRYKRFTLGVRIHHGYVGAAAVPPVFIVGMDVFSQILVGAVAAGLILSDLVHHFVVLPLTTGKCD